MANPIQAFRDYLELEKKCSAHTVRAYLDDLQAFCDFLEGEFGSSDPVSVTYQQIRGWIVAMVESGMGNSSVNRKVSSLKSFYKFLVKSRQLEASPLLKHKALRTPKVLQVPFSEAELRAVLNDIQYPEGFEGVRDKLIIDLFYTTGIRRSELINIRFHDFGTSSLKVLGKRNKERIVPLLTVIGTQAAAYLALRAKLPAIVDGEYFFLNSKGVKLSDSLVYRIINGYFSQVSEKVKKSPHILRHTFATHMLNNGADLNSVKELLGHSSLASTQVYTHNSLAELKRVYGQAHPRNRE